jgi:hypothetical protein
LLTAWSTYIIACTFGAFEHTSFEQFLEKYPPPGYVPETPPKDHAKGKPKAWAT